MGKNNKTRRAAKARQRARQRRQRRAGPQAGRARRGASRPPFGDPAGPASGRAPSESERVTRLWAEALRAAEWTPHDDFVDDHFGGRLTSVSARGMYDGAGLAYGRQAADQAELDAGEITG